MTAGEVRNVLDSHRRRRPLRVTAYLLLAAGAGVLMTDPLRTMQDVGPGIRWIWSSLLMVGTLLAVGGTVSDRYLAEFVGLPMLFVSMFAFAVVLAALWTTAGLAVSFFLASLVVVMVSRWLDLWRLVGASVRAERRRS